MSETLMTTAAENTNEGQATSEQATQAATAAAEGSQQQQVAQGTTTEGQQAEVTKTEGEQDKPAGAPEKYEFKATEGHEFDPKTIAAFSEVAKELNLSQESAQKVLDKMAPAMAEKQAAQIEQIRNEWEQSARSDKEFGGDKLNDSLASAKKALDAFGTPELRTLLDESGLGNHPDVIRFMVRAGKAISEDKFVGGKTGNRNATDAKSLYPNSNMN